jgi:hypothetical protein
MEKGIITEGELMEKCKKLRAKIRGGQFAYFNGHSSVSGERGE